MIFFQNIMFVVAVLSVFLWRWNATSVALAIAYFAVEIWCKIAGGVQPGDLFMVDLMTMLLIYCKAIARDTECVEFESNWDQFKCFVRAPTRNDRIILAIFIVVAWPLYVLNIGAASRWWALSAVWMAQCLIAGSEAYYEWRRAKARVPEPDSPSSGVLRVAWGWTGDG